MSALDTRIVSDETPRTHFTMIPNSVDDMWLDPYAFRLYCHLRRVAGEHGECWQSTATLAAACFMSTGKVSEAKRELVKMHLITITKEPGAGGVHDTVRILDIWNENAARYEAREERSPDEPKESVHVLNANQESVHRAKAMRSPGETKKNPVKNNHNEEKPSSSASQNDDADALKVSTPGTRILFAKLQRAAADQGRRGPQKFRTRQQKDQAEAAEKRLDSHMADAVDAGLRAGITDLARMIAWVNKYTPGGAKKPAKPADPEHDEFVRDWAERLKADSVQVEG